MAVSDHDRDYMRRLGEFEAAGAGARAEAHRMLSLSERLEQSILLYRRFVGDANLAARDDDPTPLYERARRLGLYVS